MLRMFSSSRPVPTTSAWRESGAARHFITPVPVRSWRSSTLVVTAIAALLGKTTVGTLRCDTMGAARRPSISITNPELYGGEARTFGHRLKLGPHDGGVDSQIIARHGRESAVRG